MSESRLETTSIMAELFRCSAATASSSSSTLDLSTCNACSSVVRASSCAARARSSSSILSSSLVGSAFSRNSQAQNPFFLFETCLLRKSDMNDLFSPSRRSVSTRHASLSSSSVADLSSTLSWAMARSSSAFDSSTADTDPSLPASSSWRLSIRPASDEQFLSSSRFLLCTKWKSDRLSASCSVRASTWFIMASDSADMDETRVVRFWIWCVSVISRRVDSSSSARRFWYVFGSAAICWGGYWPYWP
mmetsp:Transcript_33828/g.80916  ORF Transcript_33828/g.80916 Transcript_33828/m.80916 type:complete len:247 (-) Transcript_33828:613-1353(-)